MDDHDHHELLAVRCRAQTGVVPVRLWRILTSEAKARLGALTQESARKQLDSNADEAISTDGDITAEITISTDRAALDDIIGRLGPDRGRP